MIVIAEFLLVSTWIATQESPVPAAYLGCYFKQPSKKIAGEKMFEKLKSTLEQA